jgi:hypothetical protein
MSQKLAYRRQFKNPSHLKVKMPFGADGKINFYNPVRFVVEHNLTRGSLLIPAEFYEHYCERVKVVKSRAYIKSLLAKYRYLLFMEPEYFAKKLNVGYQKEHLDLQKVNVEVEAESWAELKQLRLCTNWSVCRIVSFLVQLDWMGIAEDLPEEIKSIIVPQTPMVLQRYEAVFNTKKCIYTRSFNIKRFDYYESS